MVTGRIETYRDLRVWQQSMELAENVNALLRAFPKEAGYTIVSQTMRATISIPANIAEGHARKSRREYRQYLSIARGSRAELETLLLLALRMNRISRSQMETLWPQLQSIGKMLNKLISVL